MNSKPHQSPNLIYSVGTQVVTLKSVVRANREPLHPSGAVGVIVYSPSDRQHAYRVRFPDGFEACLHHDQLALLAEYQLGNLQGHDPGLVSNSLFDRVIQTYNGYVMSQFKKMQTDLENQGRVKPKHVMHLIRLLISGIRVLREGFVPVDVGPHRPQLLAIRNQQIPWEEVEAWRKELHQQFEQAFAETRLPERPDYQRANEFLIRARRAAMSEELP